MGILEGLKFARMKGYTKIGIQNDNKCITNVIEKNYVKVKEGNDIYNQNQHCLLTMKDITISHVVREANQSTGVMANKSLTYDIGSQVYTVCPNELLEVIAKDFVGVSNSQIILA